MIRTTSIAAALAVAFAVPAAANEQAPASTLPDNTASVEAFAAQLSWVKNQKQMRKKLAQQGYIVTSDLNRIDSGHWVGTALRDGKPVRIAVKMHPGDPAAQLTN